MSTQYKVLVTSGSFGKISSDGVDILREAGCELIKNPKGRPLTDIELAEIVGEMQVDGILAGLDEIGVNTLSASDRLRVVSRHGVGVDNIDFAAAHLHSVVITNTPASNAGAVADLVFALILSVVRRITEVHSATQEGVWQRPIGIELEGKTIVIIGYGRVGQEVARRAKGFGMNVVVSDPYVSMDQFVQDGVIPASFEVALSMADVVTLHLPKTPETVGLINRNTIHKMPRGAILINTSRGDVVDEQALAEAVRSNYLAGAGVDVYQKEPPVDSSLIGVPGIVTTPHIGALSDRSIRATDMISAQNLVAVLRGEPCANTVIKGSV